MCLGGGLTAVGLGTGDSVGAGVVVECFGVGDDAIFVGTRLTTLVAVRLGT
jgi:hypothetical protein